VSWLAGAVASSVIALVQWFGAAGDLPFVSPAEAGQAYGNLRQRNQFATLTSLGLLGAIWLAQESGRPRQWLCYGAIVLLASGNAASGSRTGLLQWLLLAAALVLWPGARMQRMYMCGAALLAYTVAATLLPWVFASIHGVWPPTAFIRLAADLGCSSRAVLWSNVLHLIAQRPWTGWGWGELDFAHYATLYPGPRFCDILDNAHNLPLHLAVELGIPAALVLCAGIVWWVRLARPWSEVEPRRQFAWLALAAISVHSLLEYPLWYGPFQLAMILALWLLVRRRRHSPVRKLPALCAAALVLLAVAALAAEYARVSQAYLPPERRLPSMRHDPVHSAGRPLVFTAQLRFAELSTTPLSLANAAQVRALAREMLHYSPEPMVIERVIESASLLGDEQEAMWHMARYRAAFPERYEEWIGRSATLRRPARP